MVIPTKESVKINTTTWIEITRTKQIWFKSVKTIGKNLKLHSILQFPNHRSSLRFMPSVTLNPPRTWRKDGARFRHETRLLFLFWFHNSVPTNNTQQQNYKIFRKGYDLDEVQFWVVYFWQAFLLCLCIVLKTLIRDADYPSKFHGQHDLIIMQMFLSSSSRVSAHRCLKKRPLGSTISII